MNCCLWLNGEKIRYADDIYASFDPASLRGYFLGGSLVRWLKANGGEKEALLLEKTGCVYSAFGFEEPVGCDVFIAPAENTTASVHGSMRTSKPTSNVYFSGSGSGSLGYGLHII